MSINEYVNRNLIFIAGSVPLYRKNKKIVFLANTVPLVLQQTRYFKDNIGPSSDGTEGESTISYFIGDMGTDNWNSEHWKNSINDCHVRLATRHTSFPCAVKWSIK
jgi:hypothetical protein